MDNLVLVGFSCSGKTSIGRMLARRLRLRFVDTDRVVEQATGRSIPEIFTQDGEAAFRALEREAVATACRGRFQVVSTGGGAFVDPENRAVLLAQNLVVHLRVRPETVLSRLQNSRSGRPRPLLQHADPMQRIGELMEQRRDVYAQAHLVVDVDVRSTYELVSEVVWRWHTWRRARRQQRQPAAQPTGT